LLSSDFTYILLISQDFFSNMNHNSDFESGAFLDLECSQQFKPTYSLANFLENTEQELQAEQTVCLNDFIKCI